MLTKFRRQKGLTQRQLAQAVGCSHVAIGAYEKGRMFPSLPRARRLATILGSTIEELFRECPAEEEDTHDDDSAESVLCAPTAVGS